MLLKGQPQSDGRITGKCSGRLTISRGQAVEIGVCFRDADFELLPIKLDMPPPVDLGKAKAERPGNGTETDRTDHPSGRDPAMTGPKR